MNIVPSPWISRTRNSFFSLSGTARTQSASACGEGDVTGALPEALAAISSRLLSSEKNSANASSGPDNRRNPGGTGGSLWQGGGFDPETSYFYIPSKTGPGIISIAHDPKSDLRFSRGPSPRLSVKGLPILKPPYSRITALDLNTGEFAWMVPLGKTPREVSENPALKDVVLPNTGGINLHATLLVTKTLLIAGEGWGGEPVVRAYDKKTGAVLGEVSIPGMMGSMPMTYMVNGKQYIAFTVGTPTQGADVVSLSLEK